MEAEEEDMEVDEEEESADVHKSAEDEDQSGDEDEEDEDEPAPLGNNEDPYGLGPHRSRSPPASRAQRRSIQATASQRPRLKTKFFPSW